MNEGVPDGPFRELICRGIELLSTGREDELVLLLETTEAAEKINSTRDRFIDFLVAKASIYLHSDRWQESVEFYTEALKCEDSLELRCNRGVSYWFLGNHEKALEDYFRALEFNNNNDFVLCSIGGVYTDIKEPEKAIPYLEKAVQLNPESAQNLIYLAVARLHNGEVIKAYELFIHALKLDPSSERARSYVQRIDEDYGDDGESEE